MWTLFKNLKKKCEGRLTEGEEREKKKLLEPKKQIHWLDQF